jgi:TonB-linked SusC/RagA family outer membrane protein
MANPIYEASIGNYNKSEQFYIMNNTELQIWLKKDFRIDGSFSFVKYKNDSHVFTSPYSRTYETVTDPTLKGQLSETNSKSLTYSGKLMVSYNKNLTEKLYLSTTGGTTIDASDDNQASYQSIGYYSDKLANPSFASRYPVGGTPSGSDAIERSVGFFVNANAIYNDKYFLDLIYRYEGSSKFGKDKRFAPFWSIGAGWNIHNEAFMKHINVQLMKLRASVGYLGNVSFSPYQAMTTYTYNSSYNYVKGIGAVPITIGNPNLKWERTLNTNIGLDLTMFKRRLDLTFDIYSKQTDNLLLDVTKAPSVGVSTARENIGKIDNKGIEIQARVVPIVNKDWNWALSFNYSYNKNKIKSISDALKAQNEKNLNSTGISPLPIYEEGESLTALKVVPSAGIDPATGKEIYIKKDGTYTFVYDARDKVVFGNQTPYAYGTLGSYLTYKQFSMNLLFGYSLGGLIYNTTLATKVEGSDPRYNADERVFNDRWKKPGDHAKYKDIADHSTPMQTSRFVAVNNYLNLTTLTLAYEFLPQRLSNMGIKRLRIEFLMNDLFHLSSVKQERGTSYPYSRSAELSLRVSF